MLPRVFVGDLEASKTTSYSACQLAGGPAGQWTKGEGDGQREGEGRERERQDEGFGEKGWGNEM